MNKRLEKLKHEAIRKGAAELVTYTLGYDNVQGHLVQAEGEPIFQENEDAYEQYWYDCLDLNAIGFLGEDWFIDEVELQIREFQYAFVQDVITGAMQRAALTLKTLEYDTNLETHERTK